MLTCASLMLASLAFQPAMADREADIDALTERKTMLWPRLYRELDHEGLDAFLDDRFVMIGPDGTITPKAEEIDWMRGAETSGQPEDFAFAVERIIFPTDDTAIVIGEGTSTRTTPDGAPCAHSYRSSNTFVRHAEGWRPIASHVSGVSCSPLGD
jgi:hypothetical protein